MTRSCLPSWPCIPTALHWVPVFLRALPFLLLKTSQLSLILESLYLLVPLLRIPLSTPNLRTARFSGPLVLSSNSVFPERALLLLYLTWHPCPALPASYSIPLPCLRTFRAPARNHALTHSFPCCLPHPLGYKLQEHRASRSFVHWLCLSKAWNSAWDMRGAKYVWNGWEDAYLPTSGKLPHHNGLHDINAQ